MQQQQQPRTMLAAAALAVALLAARAAADSVLPPAFKDQNKNCVSPRIQLVDAFNLNTPTFQITPLPDGSRRSAAAAAGTSGGDSEYDSTASILASNPPYWMAPKNGKRQQPPKRFSRAAAADGAARGAALASALEAGTKAARAAAGPELRAAGYAIEPRAGGIPPTTVTIADLFSVTYYGTWKLLNNLVTNEQYVLYQCGTPKPGADTAGVPAGAKFFEIPLKSVIVPDTMALAFLSNLGLVDYAIAAPTFCTDACGQYTAVRCKYAADTDASGQVSPQLASLGAAILNVGSPDPSNPKTITINPASTAAATRPQWLKFLGAFFNRDGLASSNADTMLRQYALKRAAAATATANIPKSRAVWISSQDTYTDWGYPSNGKEFIVFGAQYKRTYVEDAGGSFQDGSQLLSSFPDVAAVELFSTPGQYQDVAINPAANPARAKAALLSVLSQADVVFDETYFVSPVNAQSLDQLLPRYDLTMDDVKDFPAFANRRVFTVGKLLSQDGFGTDWFEGANVATDRVLDDFLIALTPAVATANLKTKWLQRIAGGEASTRIKSRSCRSVRTCAARAPAATCANAFWGCTDGTLTYGSRQFHCRPKCTTKCWCCGSADQITGDCVGVCAAANKGNCPS